jgi:hypothetical protein
MIFARNFQEKTIVVSSPQVNIGDFNWMERPISTVEM